MKHLSTTYWASLPSEQIASAVNEKMDDYLQFLEASGHAQKIQKSYDLYYGFGSLGGGGRGVEMQDDSISKITVNHYKNLLSRISTMTTQAKLSFKAKAVNSDSKSLLEADFAEGLLAAEVDRGMGKTTSAMVETAVVMYGAYVYAPWNRFAGDAVAAKGESKVFAGEQEFHNLNSFSVARSTSQEDSDWYIVDTTANRWDLIASYPDHASDLLSAGNSEEINPRQLVTPFSNRQGLAMSDNDSVVVRTLLHKKTKALPSGRVTVIVGSTVIEDTDFYYKSMPVVSMKAASILGEVLGDSPASSLVGLQEVIDRVYSANITNVMNGAVSNIYCADPNVSLSSIQPGMNIINATSPPVALALTGVSPDSVNLINDAINQSTLLSGLNNTAKGNPESSLKSGTSLSLILSTAIQFISSIQQSYAQSTAELATIVIHNLQSFCKVEKLAYVAGVANKQMAKTFKADDLQGIDRISCELGNPVTQNVSGRMELVQMLIQNQVIKDPAKIDEFLRTGNWESLTEQSWSEATLVREENEMLRRGQKPIVMLTDNHPRHIQEALSVLYSQEARKDPLVTEAVLAHVNEHIEMMKQLPPDLAAILGVQPLPSQQMPPPGPPSGSDAPPAPNVNGTSLPNGRGIPPEFAAGYDQYAQQISNNPAANQDG